MTPEERQQKNLAEGRPAKSYFPWDEKEKQLLAKNYGFNHSVEKLGEQFGRSPRAVAIQLEKMALITAKQLLAYV